MRQTTMFLAAGVLVAGTVAAQVPMITTVAGNGSSGFCGDGGPAVGACLDASFVAVDAAGNLFIADTLNHRIRKVDPAGTITTVAGNGTPSFCGDGGPATSACLVTGSGVAADTLGNVFIADNYNQRIRKVDAAGIITTVAGPVPFGSLTSLALDGTGHMVVADSSANRVWRVSSAGAVTKLAGSGAAAFCGDGGPARDACLNSPIDVAVDAAGSIYIADRGNNRVRKVDGSGIITTVAGNGILEFCGDGRPATSACIQPQAVTIDPLGNLLIAGNSRVMKVDATGTLTTVLGLPDAVDLATDAIGNLFVLVYPHRVLKRDPAGGLTTVAGNGLRGFCGDGGPATSACLNAWGLAVDATGNLYVADWNNYRIRKVNPAGVISTFAGRGGFCGDGGRATEACLYSPSGVAIDHAGDLLIADIGNHRVRKVDASGTITTFAGTGDYPACGDSGLATAMCLVYPSGVAVNPAGDVLIVDHDGGQIWEVDAAGRMSRRATGLGDLYSAAVDAADDVFFSLHNRGLVQRLDAGGAVTTVAGNGTRGYCGDDGPATAACLNLPAHVTVDQRGHVFIADTENNRIRQVDAAGIITTWAGNGTGAYCGDDGPATSACLRHPNGVAVDAAGNLFIADRYNSRVRKVSQVPRRLASLSVANPLLAGCLKTTGKVKLTAPAPVGGLTVALHSDNPKVVVPASLTFKAGVLAKSFSILTSPVAVRETAVIEASVLGQTLAATQTIKPIGPKSVTLLPNPVVGGNTVVGTVMLQCPAGPGDIVVTLGSSTTAVAAPTTAAVTVPMGTRTLPFEVTTTPVDRVRKPTISAEANGVKRGKTLTVNPAP